MLNRLSVILLLLALFIALLRHPLESNNVLLNPNDGAADTARVLLLTAHPDDECLCFAPTLLSLFACGQRAAVPLHLQDPQPQDGGNLRAVDVYSLCLSTGDAHGLGKRRKEELGRSLDILGIEEARRWVVNDPKLKDNITIEWDAHTIADVVKPYILQHHIDTILTFDHGGISGHPNHISLPKGIAHLLSSPASIAGRRPRLYTLISVPTVVKYTGPVASLFAKFDIYVYTFLGLKGPTVESSQHLDGGGPMLVFVSGIKEYMTALLAMRQHGSQLVWFRRLYVLFSRYMWVNEWVEVKLDS